MKKNEAVQKIGNYLLVPLFLVLAVAGFALGAWTESLGASATIFNILGFISIAFAGWYGLVSWTVHKKYKELYASVALIETNYKQVREQLDTMGFNSEQHISALGYAYAEYRDDFNAPDNSHIEIDKANKKVALYRLLPFDFVMVDFADIIRIDLKAQTEAPTISVIEVIFRMQGGKQFSLNVADGQCFKGSAQHLTAENNAKKLVALLREMFGVGGLDE